MNGPADSQRTPGWFDLIVALVVAALVLALVFHPDPEVRGRAAWGLVVAAIVFFVVVSR